MVGLALDSSCWFCGLTDAHAPRCPRFTFTLSDEPEQKTAGIACTHCKRELCGELDAYYGFDALMASRCRDCRR